VGFVQLAGILPVAPARAIPPKEWGFSVKSWAKFSPSK
jgi:hypothetical protein